MAVEEKRILKMLYFLSQTGSYLKAGDLARELNLSERTVKNDIKHLREVAKNCGCTLRSVRGKGYILQIDQPERFAQTRKWINILFNNVENDVKEKQSYQLARAIMCGQAAGEDGFFRLEELSMSIYMSLSTVKKKMTWVRTFLNSFGLQLIARPGKGLKLYGDELGQRLCMLELYENHFHTRVVAFNNYTYERAFADQNDKSKIRKLILDRIRNSENELIDTYVNRFVDYILLQRNRIIAGRVIRTKQESWGKWIPQMKKRPEWDTASALLQELQTITGFQRPSEGEVGAVVLLLLIWGDWEQYADLNVRFPKIYGQAEALAYRMVDRLKKLWTLPSEMDACSGALIPELVRILLQHQFGYECCQMLGNAISENVIKQSPLAMALADSARMFFREEGLLISEYNTQLLAVSIFGVIDTISYPYKKRRILICARNGKSSGQIIARNIQRQMGVWWIEVINIKPLYDIRKFGRDQYDCVIGSFYSYAYRYSWPYTEVNSMMKTEDFERVHREVLSAGYDFGRLLRLVHWDVLEFHYHFAVSDLKSMLQLLAYQWGRDITAKEYLASFFADVPRLCTHNQFLTVIAPFEETGKNVFELYFMKKPLDCGENTVHTVLFFSMDFSRNPALIRFWEHAVRLLQEKFETLVNEVKIDNIMAILSERVRKEL